MPKHIAKNIILTIDFDGVIGHGLKLKLKYAKEWFGVDLRLDQTKAKSFDALMKSLGKTENYRSLMDPVNEQHIMEYEIPPGCIHVLEKLYSEGFRFAIVTSRNNHDYHYCKLFVKEKLGDLIKYIHNTRNEPKDKFVRKLKSRIHIEDDIYKLEALKDVPVELCYYRQPENSGKDLPSIEHRIVEIKEWQEFYQYCHFVKDMHEAICYYNDWPNKWSTVSQIFRFWRENDVKCEALLRDYKKKDA